MNLLQSKKLTLSILPQPLAVCQFEKGTAIPSYVFTASFYSITQTEDELSVVCDQAIVPTEIKKVIDWRAFKVEGPFSFSQIGIIASLSKPLAEAAIPIFVVSSYDTDFILVQTKYFNHAKDVLSAFCSIK